MATFRELLQSSKSQVKEIDSDSAHSLADSHVFLDVREADEHEQGAIPEAIHIPRGKLELTIEGKVSDKNAPIVVYCAGGVRSVFAAKTLQELGYQNVASLIGGFNRWKDEGKPWVTPRSLNAEQRNRYQRHILLPEVGEEGQLKLLDSKVLLLGAGGSVLRRLCI